MQVLKNVLVLSILILGAFACSPHHNYRDGSSSGGYEFNENVDIQLLENAQNLLTAKCLNCHGPGSVSGYLNFENLVIDGFIVAGPPQASILYRCINNSVCITRDGNTTDNMAINGELEPEEIELLNEFIDALFIDP